MSRVYLLNEEKQRGLSQDVISIMFKLQNITDGLSIKTLKELGGEKGICDRMQINLTVKNGLTEEQVAKYGQIYGRNVRAQQDSTPILTLVLKCFENQLIATLLTSVLTFSFLQIIKVVMTNQWDWSEWLQVFPILIVIILITGMKTFNDYMKEKKFEEVMENLNENKIQVRRNSQIISINRIEIVVGDLIFFNIGNCFSVDGIIIDACSVLVDEGCLTGQSKKIQKVPLHLVPNQNEHNLTPFLISGSKIIGGSGVMLVLAVGEQTCLVQMSKLLQKKNQTTPLQKKLKSVTDTMENIGLIFAIVTFLCLIITYIIDCAVEKGQCTKGFDFTDFFNKIIESFNICLAIIIIAVPEGLQFALTLSLAFQVNKLKEEQIIVKDIAAFETTSSVNNICTSLTGTLTQNKMKGKILFHHKYFKVVCLYHQGEIIQINQHQEIKHGSFQLLAEAICYNSSVFPSRNHISGELDSTGNKTECALLIFADQLGYDYTKYRPSNNIVISIPFNFVRKKMMTVIYLEDKKTLRIFVKGASELVLEDCISLLQPNGDDRELNEEEKKQIKNVVIDDFARYSLRTLALAYKDIENPRVNGDVEGLKQWILEQGDDYFCKDITLISIVGIKDPIRPDVPAAITQCNISGINVRMVTGDNIITAKAIARECGILDDFSLDKPSKYQVMEGKDFRKLVGGLKLIEGPEGKQIKVVRDLNTFMNIINELKILARATPKDKYILITGLNQLENVVAFIGDDGHVLRKADVGFANGITGSDVSKEDAGIILMEDNFCSIVKTCQWGRNIYNFIRKFIQIQLTVNIVVLIMAVFGAMVLKQSPFGTMELIWVELIIDTFISLALATEPPSQDVLNGPPYSNVESILNPQMYRFIIFQSLFQIACLFYILFVPLKELLIDIETQPTPVKYFLNTLKEKYNSRKEYEQLYRFSFLFQAFVIMIVFNSINSRKLDETSLNPFSRASDNPIFWIILVFAIGVQFLFIEYGGEDFVSVINLNWKQHLFCLCFGVAELVYGVLIRAIVPIQFFRFRQTSIDENQMEETLISKMRQKGPISLQTSVLDDKVISLSDQSVRNKLDVIGQDENSFQNPTDFLEFDS